MNTDEKLHDLLVKIKELTVCQACLVLLTTSSYQCPSGHGVCTRCHRRVNMCPICNHLFNRINNTTLLVQVLKALPKLCLFTDRGCKQISFNKDHEVVCEYRPFKCPISEAWEGLCWEGPARLVKDHFQEEHNSRMAFYSLGNTKKLIYNEFKGDWPLEDYLHCVDDKVFLVSGFKDATRGSFVQSVRHIPMGKSEETYYFTVTIGKEEIIYQHLLKAIPYDEFQAVNWSAHCMVVPLEEMIGLLNENGHLEVYIEATKKTTVV